MADWSASPSRRLIDAAAELSANITAKSRPVIAMAKEVGACTHMDLEIGT